MVESPERCELHDWVVREDLDSVVVSAGSSPIPILHSTTSGCHRSPIDDVARDRAWVLAARREQIAHFETTRERSLYFCEMCVIRRVDSQPKEHPTGGNPLCPRCFLHHAGDCV